MSAPKLTDWYPWPVKPTRVGWYDYRGYLIDEGARVYWNGSNWQIDSSVGVTYLADDEGDQWRGLTEPGSAT